MFSDEFLTVSNMSNIGFWCISFSLSLFIVSLGMGIYAYIYRKKNLKLDKEIDCISRFAVRYISPFAFIILIISFLFALRPINIMSVKETTDVRIEDVSYKNNYVAIRYVDSTLQYDTIKHDIKTIEEYDAIRKYIGKNVQMLTIRYISDGWDITEGMDVYLKEEESDKYTLIFSWGLKHDKGWGLSK